MLLCVLATAAPGCRKDPHAASAQAPQPRLATSPTDAFFAIRKAYEAGQLGRVEPYILPEQRVPLIDTLMAVKAMQAANQRMHAAVERQFGRWTADVLDRSPLLDFLGLFAPKVSFICEEGPDPLDGNRVSVCIQVADRLPLERINFVCQAGRWYYDPGTPVPEMPAALNGLARGLNLMADRLERNELTRDQLISEFHTRLDPVLRDVPAVADRLKRP
jgi:hypothetical protein